MDGGALGGRFGATPKWQDERSRLTPEIVGSVAERVPSAFTERPRADERLPTLTAAAAHQKKRALAILADLADPADPTDPADGRAMDAVRRGRSHPRRGGTGVRHDLPGDQFPRRRGPTDGVGLGGRAARHAADSWPDSGLDGPGWRVRPRRRESVQSTRSPCGWGRRTRWPVWPRTSPQRRTGNSCKLKRRTTDPGEPPAVAPPVPGAPASGTAPAGPGERKDPADHPRRVDRKRLGRRPAGWAGGGPPQEASVRASRKEACLSVPCTGALSARESHERFRSCGLSQPLHNCPGVQCGAERVVSTCNGTRFHGLTIWKIDDRPVAHAGRS
ncbi:hypothetical protein CA12_26610 [Alienimonas californiensis]|uniref:Uncharacterized protein n=1 Tax=Alienimonas californiensis TaxID=2527989 RepID=A0A517PB00_9PLAN|nr:hypothetical protein CA12_26610 [Alienimonas californiensis]